MEYNCYHCKGKTREDLCNELGDYRVAIQDIEYWCNEMRNEWINISDERRFFLGKLYSTLETLKEALECSK